MSDYLSDYQNILDLIGQVCLVITYAHAYMYHDGMKDLTMANFHFIGLTSILFRAFLSLFRQFQQTRFLIVMIIEVMYDMRPFMSIMTTSLIVFAVIFQRLGLSFEKEQYDFGKDKDVGMDSHFAAELWNSYNIVLGEIGFM